MEGRIEATFELQGNWKKLETLFRLSEDFHKKYCGYSVREDAMWLYWTPRTDGPQAEKFVQLPYEMDSCQITNFVYGWLDAIKSKKDVPDDCVEAFSFESNTFGDCMTHNKCDDSFVGAIVKFTWIMIGK